MKNKLIGDTPLIKINYKYKNQIGEIYTKLEYYNLTGSIKDRVAYYIITKAKERKELLDNQPIIEATSGNTGISIAALGSFYHHPVYIFMPDWVSKERIEIMKLFGARVKLYSKEEGGFKRCLQEVDKLALKINGFKTNQFSNLDNIMAHYETTSLEIIDKLKVDGFVSGIGTGGTLMGISKKLKEINKDTIIYALEPDTMSIIKTGKVESHLIEGIGDDFLPSLVNLNQIDDVILIKDKDAIKMSQKLSCELGLGVGISSGANMLAAILLKNKIGGNIVTVFPDDNKKYLTTTLTKTMKDKDFISNDIELINYEIV